MSHYHPRIPVDGARGCVDDDSDSGDNVVTSIFRASVSIACVRVSGVDVLNSGNDVSGCVGRVVTCGHDVVVSIYRVFHRADNVSVPVYGAFTRVNGVSRSMDDVSLCVDHVGNCADDVIVSIHRALNGATSVSQSVNDDSPRVDWVFENASEHQIIICERHVSLRRIPGASQRISRRSRYTPLCHAKTSERYFRFVDRNSLFLTY